MTFAEELFSSMAVGTKFTDEKPILVAIRSLSDFAQIDFILKIKLSILLFKNIILHLVEKSHCNSYMKVPNSSVSDSDS